MEIELTPTQKVKSFGEPYIIAEIGANHNGDLKLAEQLIRSAKKAGADCVKFQSWTKDTLFSKKVYEKNRFQGSEGGGRSLEEVVEQYSLSETDLLQLKKIANEVSIDLSVSCFSKKEVDFAFEKLNIPFIKIASMDVNNYPFLEYIAKKNRPIVISTGLSTLSEVDKAITTIESQGNKKIVLLHCIADYPPADTEVHLNNIKTYQTLYPYPVGFSDHTIGTTIPLASVAMGACVIEKHFTLDKQMPGWDHAVSGDEAEFRILCTESKRIQQALGATRIMAPESDEKRKTFRRSIVAARNIEAGETISSSDIDFKRPGTGLPPEIARHIIGKIAKNRLEKDQLISRDDF